MTVFSPHSFRQHFPLICCNDNNVAGLLNPAQENKPTLVYLDNAATTQKPKQVIDVTQQYYSQLNANVHRSSHQLSTKTTVAYEEARYLAKQFIGANTEQEIVWTRGTTESINIITQSLARNMLKTGDEILLTVSEHHANIVPWQIVAKQTGAVIKVLPINSVGTLDLNALDNIISSRTKFVSCAHISNVIGKINPIEQVIAKAKNIGAITVIDGAQYVAHFPVNVQSLNCDFYAFSAHKMFGPTGVGVLYGKKALLESMAPYQGGGEMIKAVSFEHGPTFNELPFKFEAGTPNIAGIIGLAESIRFLRPLIQSPENSYSDYEKSLVTHCYDQLKKLNGVKFLVEQAPDIGVISFTVSDHHNQDISSALDNCGIAIRTGHHCAMPLMESLNSSGCLRVSIAPYNTYTEIDYFVNCLKKIINDPGDIDEVQSALHDQDKAPADAMTSMLAHFSAIKGWDSRHREIMLLGKKLPRLDKSLRSEQTIISGCESLAWLKSDVNKQGQYCFTADSDAKIIRGLLVIVLAAYNNKTAKQIRDVDIKAYFKALGLMQHLSPSRGNGLLSIVDKIQKIVS